MTQKNRINKSQEKESLDYDPNTTDPSSFEYMLRYFINSKQDAEEMIKELLDIPEYSRKRALSLFRSCGVYYSKLPS